MSRRWRKIVAKLDGRRARAESRTRGASGIAISSFTAAVDESELPDGLGAWWNKMLKTKAVAALKGKGKKLMPGEHNKAW